MGAARSTLCQGEVTKPSWIKRGEGLRSALRTWECVGCALDCVRERTLQSMAKHQDEKCWMHPQIVNGKACLEGFWADEVTKGHRGLDFLQWRRGVTTAWRAQLVTVGGCAIGSDMNGGCLGLIRLGS